MTTLGWDVALFFNPHHIFEEPQISIVFCRKTFKFESNLVTFYLEIGEPEHCWIGNLILFRMGS